MQLKYWTSALLAFGITLVMAAPFLLSDKPQNMRSPDGQFYVLKFGIYTVVTAFVWVSVAVCALLLIRAIRRQMMEERELNLRLLMEGTLNDHAKRAESGQGESNGSVSV